MRFIRLMILGLISLPFFLSLLMTTQQVLEHGHERSSQQSLSRTSVLISRSGIGLVHLPPILISIVLH